MSDRSQKNSHLLSRGRFGWLLIGLLTLSWWGNVSAQELRSYFLTCDPAGFEYLITHPEENYSIACALQYDSQTWSDASLSLRNGSYRYFPKKSFKIDFADSQLFEGRDKMNLMAEWTDSSFCRQYLAYDLSRRAGLFAPQTWFARLYVNGAYLGLYLDVEEVDERFLLRAGLPENASIYKADTVGCLLAAFEPTEELWVKVTNASTGYYDLNNLITWIDTTPDELFFTNLADHFQPQELARAMAANALIGNQSTYYDNYILIHDLGLNGLWRLLPWDADSTLVYGSDYDDPQYYRCGHPMLAQTNALLTRCWRDAEMRSSIFDHMSGLMDSLFTESYYQWITDTLAVMLYDAVLEDTLKQFGVDEFLAALADIPTHVANRSTNQTYRMEHEPLPFNLNPAILTPAGVYFSWDSTAIADGSPVTYAIKIADNPLFSGYVDSLNTGCNLSLLYSDILPGNYYWRVCAYSPSNQEVRSLAFYSPFEVPVGAFSGTTVTGTINASTTWDLADSPYSLPEGLTVAPGAVLTIEPGVLVGIGTRQSITVYGGLIAIGTAEDSIHFVPIDPDSNWASILMDLPTDEINMAFVSIAGGSDDPSVYPDQLSMVKAESGQLNIYDSHLRYGARGAISTHGTAVHLERVLFDHFKRTIVTITGLGSFIIRSCSFSHGILYPDVPGQLDFDVITEGYEISRCEFYAAGDDAIDCDMVHNIEISNNIITGSLDKGISIGWESGEISIFNNIITECRKGIAIKTASSAVLYNNLISSNDEGLSFPYEAGPLGQVTIRNTAIWQNTENIQPSSVLEPTVEYCLIGGAEPYPGPGNINSDPQFVDQWNGNYYPLESSPLIDAGYGTGNPELDFNDSARYDIPWIPNTGAGEVPYVDIGVYEYYPPGPGVNESPQQPESFILLENYPNPFNAVTKISFNMQQYGWAEISIYDVLGRRVFTRRFEKLLPGCHSLLWNGRSEAGYLVASGVYLYRLETKLGSVSKKMILLK